MDLRLNEHGYQPQGRDDSGGRPNLVAFRGERAKRVRCNAGVDRFSGYRGTRRLHCSHHLKHRCATSTGSQYMSGQPPTMQWIPWAWHS